MGENEAVVSIVVSFMFFALIIGIIGMIVQYNKDRAKAQIEKDKIKLLENAILMGYSPDQVDNLRSIVDETIKPKSSTLKLSEKLVDSLASAVSNIGTPQNSDRTAPPRVKN